MRGRHSCMVMLFFITKYIPTSMAQSAEYYFPIQAIQTVHDGDEMDAYGQQLMERAEYRPTMMERTEYRPTMMDNNQFQQNVMDRNQFQQNVMDRNQLSMTTVMIPENFMRTKYTVSDVI